MSQWSLSKILDALHDDIQTRLETVRKTLEHPGTKGDASESVWLSLLQAYLPHRYQAATAHVVDSKGVFSEQIDVVIFDRQYSPFIFCYEGATIVPAESVYAVFEAKQVSNKDHVTYAQKKIASVRRLHCTSLPIPNAAGTYPAKPPIHIYGGLLTLDSKWKRPFDKPFLDALNSDQSDGRLDIGCVAKHGYYHIIRDTDQYEIHRGGKPATAFLFKLISQLQFSGTVPMIDIQAYAQWLSK